MSVVSAYFRNHRLSDVITALCIPASLFLCLHVTFLTQSLQQQNYEITQLRQSLAFSGIKDFSNEIDDQERTLILKAPSSNFSHGRFNQVEIGPPLNITAQCRGDLLLFTPILRCGSTTFKNVLKRLKKKWNFEVLLEPRTKSQIVHISAPEIRKSVVKNISSINDTVALFQAFAFINFTEYGERSPVLASIVRDPVERAVSWFYHVRAPFQLIEKHNNFPDTTFPSRAFLKKDFETCLQNRDDIECRYYDGKEILGHTIEFFCGHHEECVKFGSRFGLQRAKENVEKGFAVVGILEELNKTMTVFEHYIPRFFKGASDVYYEIIHGSKKLRNENFYKPSVEKAAKMFMRKNFTVEQEFYDFLRQRLDRQFKAVNLPGR